MERLDSSSLQKAWRSGCSSALAQSDYKGAGQAGKKTPRLPSDSRAENPLYADSEIVHGAFGRTQKSKADSWYAVAKHILKSRAWRLFSMSFWSRVPQKRQVFQARTDMGTDGKSYCAAMLPIEGDHTYSGLLFEANPTEPEPGILKYSHYEMDCFEGRDLEEVHFEKMKLVPSLR
jgi:hypothetical protein